ncbi:hypothetical protein KIPE111705_04725 [Kibdelosporangium persicum]|uniref:NlpC/P60 domain-containing protein n=1 Tax=Kibdelosporangium persicum TaxID=2698649 RepID=A0ABX2F6C5_9PSEU|nr:hypothetical protein [Kibdelosporangium persicum]NRN66437.1 hypothetical protein [Kibdelosporangium persicum]
MRPSRTRLPTAISGPEITRSEIIRRAKSWLRPSVPYSQTSFHENEHGTYRTDCSGYVSMAWALPGKPSNRHGGLDTIGLAAVSSTITKSELLAGDVLLRVSGTNLERHVTIFDKWVDETGDAYWGFEQAGGVGTVHRILDYPYDDTPEMYWPVRYVAVV